jgi:hypothetical protein
LSFELRLGTLEELHPNPRNPPHRTAPLTPSNSNLQIVAFFSVLGKVQTLNLMLGGNAQTHDQVHNLQTERIIGTGRALGRIKLLYQHKNLIYDGLHVAMGAKMAEGTKSCNP